MTIVRFLRQEPLGMSLDEPEIGDMDEGIIEGSEDTGDSEDEFTLILLSVTLGGIGEQ